MRKAQRDGGLLGGMSLAKAAINLVGFAVGVGLLVWIVRRAIAEGDWSKLRGANPALIAGLLASTVVSLSANGATFWITGRPLKKVSGFWDLQRLNAAASVLNYAPLRLGALLRVAYHLKVDRLTLLQLGAWFSFIGYLVLLGVGSCLVATLLRDRLDLIWVGLVLGQMILGALVIRVAAGNPILQRYTRGVDQIVTDPWSLWGGVGLRVIDLAAYSTRIALAAAILEMKMPGTHLVVLAVVALAASLVPFGRLGFREACVALTAERLGMLGNQVEDTWNKLALVDSMGEAAVFIPLGGLSLMFWLRKRWSKATSQRDDPARIMHEANRPAGDPLA